jgi:hypothetical protein
VIRKIFALFTLLLLMLPGGCHRDRDEEAIRALLEGMRAPMEKKLFPEALTPLTETYSDNFNPNRQILLERLNGAFSEYDRLAIRYSIEKLERNGPSASVLIRVKVTGIAGTRQELVFGNPLFPQKVEVLLEKQLGTWRLTSSRILSKLHR